jgi:hypothetical protein
MGDYNKTLGLHDLKEGLKKSYGKQLIENLKMDWIFNRPIEKIIIAGSFLFTVFMIIKILIGLIR